MSSPVAIGSLIAGKYRVERVLGQGGMGVVVVATHDELDQRVAIKFLLPDALTDADWVSRFAREARAATRIKSEHAVKVYDVGKLESGAPYMVMEYLEGQDLQSILNERRLLPIPEVVEYLLQACEAIAEAHGAGVVHRDLKPANLFVTHRTDGSPCVKILDFGISKVTPLTGARDQTVTNTTAIVGSPLYMSPEQMKASKNVDRRTDIWSLGVILQELVSGAPSFVANTTAELCALVLTDKPTPLRSTLPDAPAGLEAIIERCLRKSPLDRYETVAELAMALEPFGPPSVKTSVERIVRLAGGQRSVSAAAFPARAPEPAPSDPGPVSIVPFGQRAGDVSSLGQTEMSDSGATRAMANVVPDAPPVVAQPPGGTAAAWGSSQAAAKKSRMPLMIGSGACAAIAVLAILYVALKKDAPTAGTTAATAPITTTVATTAVTSSPMVMTAEQTTALTTPPTPTALGAREVPHVADPTSKATNVKPPPSSSASTKKPAAPIDTSGFGGRN
jgi:serine/threonine-protein kinase